MTGQFLQVGDVEAQRMMLGIAAGYDRLAEHAEKRLFAATGQSAEQALPTRPD